MTHDTPLGPESKPTIAPNVYARPFGEEVVLLDFGSGEYFGLDEVGAEIWRGLERGLSLREIASGIVERFDVGLEDALADTIALVGELRKSGLVRA